VRGLDYYTRTTFEFDHPALGAQSGIGGGGRYDGLMASLGGPDMTGIGFGLGTDRTLLACRAEGLQPGAGRGVEVFIVPLGEAARDARSRPGMAGCGQTGSGRHGLRRSRVQGCDESRRQVGARDGRSSWGRRNSLTGRSQIKDLANGDQRSPSRRGCGDS
jgi:histidyl-tRNA synthetase